MKNVRKWVAVGCCGAIIGVSMSVFSASPATAKAYARCSQEVETMEKQAAKDYKKGKLSAAQYAKVQAEIAYHRQLWGC